ncbi:MAG: LysM peptidoglycan-binding domain-containing protein [Aeromicrobium erythreum]
MPTTTNRPSGRLPVITEVPSRGAQVAKGLAALAGTALIVVGVPIALLAAFGTPWPDEKPSLEWLTAPTTSEAILGVLAVVVWLAWLHFVVCLVVEAVAERRHRGLAPQVPGGGVGTQALARRLIATIVLVGATTAVGMGSASAATTDDPGVATFSSSTAVTAASLQTPIVDQEVADEAGLPELGDLQTATDVDQASDEVTTYYDVKPPNGRHYDTLWDIADRYLGDGLRYKEIWELNKGVEQPDGRILTNPDLIYPGWVMKMPADAKGDGLKVVNHAEPPAPQAPSEGDGALQRAQDGAGDTAAAESGGAGSASSDGIVPNAWEPFFGVAGGLALAGAFLGLRRQRASMPSGQRWALRRAGRPGPGTDPDTDPTTPGPGARLRDEADVATAGWLDGALRSWNDGGGAPHPVRVSLGSAGLAVAFEEAPDRQPPQGWRSEQPGVWTLPREAAVAGSGPSPVPGLVTLGRRDDGSLLLLDLESVRGVVALEGADRVARGVALSMAVDTATHPWADRRTVTLVGFADDVSRVGGGSVRRTDDVGRVLETLDNVAREQRSACQQAGVASVREGRVLAPQASDWTYHLVLCSGLPDAEQLARLTELAADPMVSLAVVVVGSTEAEVRLTAREDGRLVAPLVGVDVAAQVLDVPAAQALAALYDLPESSRRVTIDDLVDVLVGEAESSGVAAEAVAHARVLGPVQVDAPGEIDPQRHGFLSELLLFLALHPEGVHANRVTAALWPRGVDDDVRDQALRQLDAWLGTTADGRRVLEQDAGVWRLVPGAVWLDWDAFREALNRAAHDGSAREQHLRSALELVRGLPFDGVPEQRYAWLESVTAPDDIALAVVLTAQAAAELAAGRGDEPAARGLLQRGLDLLPANEELWRARLRLANAFGDRAAVEAVADELYAAVAAHGSPIGASAQTDTLVDELLPGYRSRVA